MLLTEYFQNRLYRTLLEYQKIPGLHYIMAANSNVKQDIQKDF